MWCSLKPSPLIVIASSMYGSGGDVRDSVVTLRSARERSLTYRACGASWMCAKKVRWQWGRYAHQANTIWSTTQAWIFQVVKFELGWDITTSVCDIAKSGYRIPLGSERLPTLTTNSKLYHLGRRQSISAYVQLASYPHCYSFRLCMFSAGGLGSTGAV